ncbi:hypothetical protein ACVNS2_08000 [Paenibacillus caseinilyticus]|uniref:Uncharacterized protein n=1 Tax=Paenibacillus mucilaginosus K02 TaxID=997761 RepID=I0BE10_9BACL|nr:hypothetical protein [Paenibacillus mucilaginosus]AFH60607.1 hypothetical protein B2K_07705 [Paenibacillus mucilaginosus K02]
MGYRVLVEFIDRDQRYYPAGDEYRTKDQDRAGYLIELGFLEAPAAAPNPQAQPGEQTGTTVTDESGQV